MNNNSLITINSGIIENTEHVIVFSAGEKYYAVNIKNVLEVINLTELEIPMQTPKGIIGVFNYNGVIISAVDICAFLGVKTQNFSVNNKLIITVVNDSCFAILADKIINIYPIYKQNIQTFPYNLENSILKEIYKTEENNIEIINLEQLNNIISQKQAPDNTIDYTSLFPSDEKSKEILKLRAEKNKLKTDNYSFPINMQTTQQYILFTIANHNYYLDLKYIKEFVSIKRLNITKLPYTKDYIKGIINSKGDSLVVIDLKCFLNNEINEIKEGSKLIITEGKNFNLALLVDEIKYIKNIKDIEKNSSYSGNSKYILEEFTYDNELYSILNYEKIITDEKIYIDIN